MQESKQEVTKVVSLVKKGENLPSVFSPLNLVKLKFYNCLQLYYLKLFDDNLFNFTPPPSPPRTHTKTVCVVG